MTSTTMPLRYAEADLMRDHDYEAPHVVDARLLHGGMLAGGVYQPPRALVREQALAAWEAALAARGGAPLDADASLLTGERVPSVEQSRVLLRHGIGETFWNAITARSRREGASSRRPSSPTCSSSSSTTSRRWRSATSTPDC